jgi:hypothetical protein
MAAADAGRAMGRHREAWAWVRFLNRFGHERTTAGMATVRSGGAKGVRTEGALGGGGVAPRAVPSRR